jgi:hypothetical protein
MITCTKVEFLNIIYENLTQNVLRKVKYAGKFFYFHENFRYFRKFALRNFRRNENKFSPKCENENFRFNPSHRLSCCSQLRLLVECEACYLVKILSNVLQVLKA